MKKLTGKIILVDNEKYEKELLEKSLQQKDWDVEIEYFTHSLDALEYLKKTKDAIFLIISEFDLVKMNGLEMKKAIDEHLEASKRAVPFIFLSNTETKQDLKDAYLYRVGGSFKKPSNVDKQAEIFDIIIRYWIVNNHPNKLFSKENSDFIE
ncbi:MAG: response regulator [Bacteroidetes bacterium]|nr:response regulator [Bacteroidota bacterium]MBA3985969.1 response regulator [Flavobacteriales bacterium]MDQ3192976.1 response regulator [Bacteroidota bacterium]HET6243448.1 response regulator [Bacteroidia bacterium]